MNALQQALNQWRSDNMGQFQIFIALLRSAPSFQIQNWNTPLEHTYTEPDNNVFKLQRASHAKHYIKLSLICCVSLSRTVCVQ